jgi:hypothetical protein
VILIEKVGYGEFDGVTGGAVHGSSKKGRERRNWQLGYIVILTKGVKEGVLELG